MLEIRQNSTLSEAQARVANVCHSIQKHRQQPVYSYANTKKVSKSSSNVPYYSLEILCACAQSGKFIQIEARREATKGQIVLVDAMTFYVCFQKCSTSLLLYTFRSNPFEIMKNIYQ